MNVAYILTSTPNDTYYEQTVISVFTLRKVMPKAEIYILLDDKTKATLTEKRTKLDKYNVNYIQVDVPQEFNNRDRSRFIKTSMNKYLPKDFVFIDNDTIITESFEELPLNYDVGMVLNRHMKISESPSRDFIQTNVKSLGWHDGYEDKHFNSGFISVRGGEKSDKLFSLWHELWDENRQKSNGTVFDQTALNEANYRMNGVITELSGIWNCQVSRNCKCAQFIHDAKILHTFTSPKMYAHDIAKPEILKSALEDEHPELDKILANPKAAFHDVYDLNTDYDSVELARTPIGKILLKSYKKNGGYFKFCNFIARILSKFCE